MMALLFFVPHIYCDNHGKDVFFGNWLSI